MMMMIMMTIKVWWSVKHRYNDTERGNAKYWERKLPH